ncbi:MAG TPA: hypothetical protein DIC52_05920 [Candidatus Latescibacteria bacterium]|nr:hypothetical protein [Candidatus Latescibacterota bacterium]
MTKSAQEGCADRIQDGFSRNCLSRPYLPAQLQQLVEGEATVEQGGELFGLDRQDRGEVDWRRLRQRRAVEDRHAGI